MRQFVSVVTSFSGVNFSSFSFHSIHVDCCTCASIKIYIHIYPWCVPSFVRLCFAQIKFRCVSFFIHFILASNSNNLGIMLVSTHRICCWDRCKYARIRYMCIYTNTCDCLFCFVWNIGQRQQIRTIHQRHHQLMASCKCNNTSAESTFPEHFPFATFSLIHPYI